MNCENGMRIEIKFIARFIIFEKFYLTESIINHFYLEITDPNEEYRLIAWSVFLGILGGLILFLCIMDFPLTYLVNKFNEKKKMVMSKHLARKEVILLGYIFSYYKTIEIKR